ncbi:hypothetical protein NQ314_019104 [Rhamnusium bicolor]|uniref:Cytochrome P450 n=1 Tax=Rhamnusium bicolor TaxID=1586634 RepID=A0AAV8WPB8_9CUCU|nr:hypothetical protein NQ314_019104 [Rhamnusium bicolor]
MLMLIIGVAVMAVLFYYLFIKPLDYWKERGVKQGKPWWIFGDFGYAVLRLQSLTELMQYAYNQTPGTRYFGLYQFVKPILILKDPDLIKQITVKDFDHFTDHRSFASEDPLWTKNLFVLKDEEVVTVEMKDIFTRFTNDVIATTAFGVKVDSLAEKNNEFYLMGKEATDLNSFSKNMKFLAIFFFPTVSKVLKLRLFSNEVTNFFRQLVNNTIKIREERAIVRPDMIHLLMEARKGIHKNDENSIIDTGFATAQESDFGNYLFYLEY